MNNPTPSWLNAAVFYEIYPQSFHDSNGDGIGDLRGIIDKLDYVQSLGCSAIWLNPCFESPFGDAGYDVSDFYKVAARYGTNADLKRLFRAAHRRGMKVVLDLVAGHTSVEHPWFKASARPEKNLYTNWYIWTDNAWTDPGQDVVTVGGLSDRDGQYAKNFFPFQPALNYGFANPDPARPWQLPVDHPDVQAVRREMSKIMRFWLDMGADGFRVDMASSLVKHDPDFRETMAFWREVRAMYDRDYPEAVLIAEWSMPSLAIAAGFHVDFMIHFGSNAYTSLLRHERERDVFGNPFSGSYGHSFFDRAGKGDIREFLDDYLQQYESTRELGYISIPTGNHDISRLNCGRTEAELEVAFAFFLTMPGIPYLYMGDEIGMAHVHGLVSKEGGYGRTGARTPMQWDTTRNAGFSSAPAKRLYLPIDPRRDRNDVASQEADPDSLLHAVRALSRLRHATAALQAESEFIPLQAERGKYPFVYLRRLGGECVLIAINPSATSVSIRLKTLDRTEAATLKARDAKISVGANALRLEMGGISYGIFRVSARAFPSAAVKPKRRVREPKNREPSAPR